MFTSSDCDAEGDLLSSFQCGDYAENCPKNRTSDMEIRGKQRGAGSKQVTLGKHPNIYFAELDKRGERHFSWEQIKNHITGRRSELISNEKYRSR